MNMHLTELFLQFNTSSEIINFSDFSYFYGQMGAGKSTIARLIDYCLGGDLREAEMTPALQTQFVFASLSLLINKTPLTLERNAHSNQVRARWDFDGQAFGIMIPARVAAGEVLPDSGVEVLSDLIFYLSGKKPPRVRRSKTKEDSELERLSFRDLYWYCYLDQDNMDSSFFNLDDGANYWKKLKSRDVLRFIVGFHQEQVAELEAQLELARADRLKCEAGAAAISEALNSAEITSQAELDDKKKEISSMIAKAEADIDSVRAKKQGLRSPSMESLQEKAQRLAQKKCNLERAIEDIKEMITRDKAHKY
ncbi:MAG: AAA family ATPase, partial [Veillonellaceae bacterium]|nr:AAA family ATPase [Veillonellaceae bacterium]